MKWKLIFFITIRLLFHYDVKKHKLGFLPLPLFSIILVAFCIFVPLIVLSVTNGFQFFTIDTYKKIYAPYTLSLKTPMDSRMLHVPSHTSPYFEDFIMISNGQYQSTALLQAYSSSSLKQNSDLSSKLKGYLPLKDNEVILATNLAYSTHIKIGQPIKILSLPPFDTPSVYRSQAIVKGIISFSNARLDATLMITSDLALERLLKLSKYTVNYVSGSTTVPLNLIKKEFPSFELLSFKEMPAIKKMIRERNFLKMILLSISFICFFAIFMTLQVSFLDNIKNIAILKVLGIAEKNLTFIFLLHGLVIGLLGIIVGLIVTILITPHIGEILTLIEYLVNLWATFIKVHWPGIINPYWSFEIMPNSIFYVTKPPIKMIYGDFLLQVLTIVGTTFLASLIPSHKIEKEGLISSIKYNN